MSDTHHLLIPYAATTSQGCQQALSALALPHLNQLLTRLAPDAKRSTTQGEETQFSTPHERALAQALGLPTQDGAIPWAAWERVQQGQPTPHGEGWAFMTPCHWQVSTDHVTLRDPDTLGLDEAASRALLAIVAPWFAEDGITLHYERPTRWLASAALFGTLATASLERVLLRDVRSWMPDVQQARTLHRLHSEMQMLLYTHPFNDARTERGLPPVNSFWVHGTGAWPAGTPTDRAAPMMPLSLREPALHEDGPRWASAWQALDAGPVAELLHAAQRGESVRLTLCGERNALSFHSAPRSLWQRIQGHLRPTSFQNMAPSL